MAARAGTGTAIGLAVCTAFSGPSFTKTFKFSNTYDVVVTKAGLLSLRKNGAAPGFSNLTQSQFTQLWQDMSQMGALG